MYSYTTSNEYHKYLRSFPNKYPVYLTNHIK